MDTCYPYNFKRFKISHFDFDQFPGPKEGEGALDYEAFSLDGRSVQFFEYFDKPVVFTCGSYSCPHFAGKINKMNELQNKYPGANFVVLYTREAHPGGRLPPHGSIEEKLNRAKRVKESLKDHRTILVDDLEGSAHEKYGLLPNSVYIIDNDAKKRVLYRDAWESTPRIDMALKRYFNEEDINPNQLRTIRRKSRSTLYYLVKLVKLAGVKPTWDLIRAMIVEVKGQAKRVRL